MERPYADSGHSNEELLRCPWRYQQRKYRGAQDKTGVQAVVGLAGHGLAERYVAHLQRRRRRRDLDAINEMVAEIVETLPEEMQVEFESLASIFFACFELDKKADRHICEQRLAFKWPSWEPIDISPYLGEDERTDERLLPFDVVSGKPDLVVEYDGGKWARIWDYKMGQYDAEGGAARVNQQLKLYAALWMIANPCCEYVEVRLWGVRRGPHNQSWHKWTRDIVEEQQGRARQYFTLLDALWLHSGENDWPVNDTPASCRYCELPMNCPKNKADLERFGILARIYKESAA